MLSNQVQTPIYTVSSTGALVLAGFIYQNDAGQVIITGLGSGGGGGGSGPTLITQGQIQLSGGAATVNNAGILATSKVAFSLTSPNNSGFILPTASSGSMTFTSSNNADTSLINYDIFA